MINSNWGWFATVLGLGFPHYSQSYGIILLWTSNFRQTLTHIHIFYGKSQRRNSRPHHRSDRPSHRTLLLWTSAGQFWMASVWRPAIFVLWLAYISIQTTSHTYNHLYIYIHTCMDSKRKIELYQCTIPMFSFPVRALPYKVLVGRRSIAIELALRAASGPCLILAVHTPLPLQLYNRTNITGDSMVI